MSLRISEKHGVNPSLGLCFYCQEAKEVVLLGLMKGDKKAPRMATYNTEPCSKCNELMEQGVTLISVRDGDEGSDNPYRTGGWCVVTDDFITRLIEQPDLRDSILERRMCWIPDKV